jgi:hypothetical protein
VDGGGFEAGVAEKLLDVADVRAAIEKMQGAGVAKQMRAAFGDAGGAEALADEAAERVGVEAAAVAGEELSR